MVANVLDYRGTPAAAEDWSFAPFADQGAWFGMALGAERGFSGPFLMTSGRWLGAELATLRVRARDGSVLPTREGPPEALPGMLRRESAASGWRTVETLWFDSASTALYRVELDNTGASALSLTLEWSGSVFPDQGRLEPDDRGVLARSIDGSSFLIEAQPPSSAAVIEGSHYRLGVDSVVELEPGDTATTTLALTFSFDDATASTVFPDVAVSFQRNRERWARYMRSIDTGLGPADPRQIIAVKSLLTLVSNWRAPLGRLRHDGLFPSSNIHYFNGFWAWDSWKHAVALVRFDPELAKEQIRAMFDHQDASGMIADVVYLDPAEDNWRDSKPPLAGWAIESVFAETNDLDFVRELYPKLSRYHAFWSTHRDHDRDGLSEYGSTDGTLEAARWESGMDNAVRFDDARMVESAETAWSMSQESVDLNSYLYYEKLVLGRLAAALERHDEAARFDAEAERLGARIRAAMFDEDSGWFYDIDSSSGAFVPVQGPEGFIPLWVGIASVEQAARARAIILDEEKFRTYLPFPTIVRDHPGFSDGYWRGLVWLDQAYFGIRGLARYGYSEDARELTNELFSRLEGAAAVGPPLFENYDPLTGEGRNAKHFSWTAAHLLLLALDEPGTDAPP